MPDRPAPNSAPSRSTTSRRLALRFISGKYQGGEYPLDDGREVVVGRSSDLDMVLVEEMVSRRHARIRVTGGTPVIEDLGSTNGTFVNGEKVQRATLQEGDRVLIGTSILKLVNIAAPTEMKSGLGALPKGSPSTELKPVSGEAPRMSGSLEEIPLPDLMQLFGTSRKNGVLVLRSGGKVGRIYLRDGVVYYASIEGLPQLMPTKAAYRMLSWTDGHFELDPPDATEFANAVQLSAHELLMEGFRQQDELEHLRHKLPAMNSRMALRTPLEAPLHELEPTQLEVLQLSLNSKDLQTLFDRTELTDLRTAEVVLELMKRGYLQPR